MGTFDEGSKSKGWANIDCLAMLAVGTAFVVGTAAANKSSDIHYCRLGEGYRLVQFRIE